MTYVEGKSGNPAGRRRGSRNKVTLALEALLEGQAEEITKKLLDYAWLGNPTAMRICFDRLLPRRRFDLPRITSVADLPAACAAICDGIANGDLNAIEAERLSRMVESMARTLRPLDPETVPALASAKNLQAAAAADRPVPPPESTAPPAPPLASAANLQAAAAAERPVPPPESTALSAPPLASATNLQADAAADRPPPPPESTAPPAPPLASATDLQADADTDADRSGPSPWMREFLGELCDDEPKIPSRGHPPCPHHKP